MKTTRPAQLANVVNASVTIFIHSVQRLNGGAHRRRASGSTDWRAMLESSESGFDPPIDLVHLASQCLGDHELQVQLLDLFRRQAPVLTAQLSDSPPLSLESRGRIAHMLRGSALAVGARRVVSAAWRIEELAAGSAATEAWRRRAPSPRFSPPSPKPLRRSTAFATSGPKGPTRRRRFVGLFARTAPTAFDAPNALSAPPRLLYGGALCIAGGCRRNPRAPEA